MKVLLSKEELHDGVTRMADQIAACYQDRQLTIIGILTGSVVLMADLIRMIDVPLELAEKAAVYVAMRAVGVNNSELARLMGVRETIVRRILDPKNATRPETIRQALACLGKTVTLTLNAA